MTQIVIHTIPELTARIEALRKADKRVIIGITGAPGAGKTSLGEYLAQHYEGTSVLVGMDGYHFAQQELRRLNREETKGAPDTFDEWGYLSLLKRLRTRDESVVYAPKFSRDLEEPIGSAVPVPSAMEIVFTEGNYLLLDEGAWSHVPDLLDEIWFVSPSQELRMKRLIDRHVAFGRSPEAAEERSKGSDERNAELISSRSHLADVLVISDHLLETAVDADDHHNGQ